MSTTPLSPPPVRPRWSTGRVTVLTVTLTVIVCAVIFGVTAFATDPEPAPPLPRTTTEATQWDPGPDWDPSSDTLPRAKPTTADYTVALVTTDSQCFGSAGCLVTVVPQVTWTDRAAAYGQAVQVTYQIDGDDDGPIIDTVSVAPTGSYAQRPIMVSTVDSSVVPAATVTMVR